MQIRTKEIYETHCEGLCGPLRDHFSTTYGMTENSVLNRCQYFLVTKGLVPDIMHDIPEGTFFIIYHNNNYPIILKGSLKLCVKLLLNHYIYSEKLFSLTHLNEKISSFDYGNDSNNKPSPISKNHIKSSELKQSGMCTQII